MFQRMLILCIKLTGADCWMSVSVEIYKAHVLSQIVSLCNRREFALKQNHVSVSEIKINEN